MTLYQTTLRYRASLLGFTPAIYDLSDKPVRGLTYLSRNHEGQIQYLSLCCDEYTRLVEAVVEVFATARDPKARRAGKLRDQQLKGAAALYTNLARDWESIQAMVSTIYTLAPDKA